MTFANVLAHLKAQRPAEKKITDQNLIKTTYRSWRIRVMYSSFLGYAIFYFVRKNLSAATPAMLAEGYTKTQIGGIWSLLYLTYAVSKFLNGVIGDRANPRYFIAIGLVLSALTNIFFGMSSSILVLGIFWALNGWFQGMGWPPCARLLTQWYSPNERGTTWAIWNTSHQIGGGLILILGGWITQNYGWRASFYIPAAIAIVTAAFMINRLRDTPEAMGLPSIEDYRNDSTRQGDTHLDNEHPVKDILYSHVLKNRTIWFLAIANFFVYIVRYGAMDWAPTFLVEVKHSTIASASAKTALFEFIGIAGAFLAGWMSDKFFAGRRWIVNVLYMLVLAFAVLEFWFIPPGHPVLDSITLAAVGFLVYGPQMLVGVCAADAASKNAAATATGFTGFWGYMGSILSAGGVGWIVDHYGWNGGFLFLIGSAVIGAALFALSYPRKKAAVRAAAPVA